MLPLAWRRNRLNRRLVSASFLAFPPGVRELGWRVIGSRQLGEHESRLKGFARDSNGVALRRRSSFSGEAFLPNRPYTTAFLEGYDIDSIA